MRPSGVRWTALVLALLLLGGCGRQSARISGMVTSAEGNSPLSGISVHIDDQAVTTNDKGQYELVDLDPGSYIVRVEAEGYEPWSREVVLKSGSEYLLDITLLPAPPSYGQVQGIVRDAQTGDPIARVLVSLAGEDQLTDEQGQFMFTQTLLGEHTLRVIKEGYQGLQRVVIVSSKAALVLELVLLPERASEEPGAGESRKPGESETLPVSAQASEPSPGFSFPPDWLAEDLGQWEGETSAEYEWDDYRDGHRVVINADHILTSRISHSTGPISDFAIEVGVTQNLMPTAHVRTQWFLGQRPEGYIASYYGVVFRSLDEDNGYAFLVSTNGYYMVWKFLNGEDYVLVPWTPSDLIRHGRDTSDYVNRLGIVAQGTDFEFYINGILVSAISDDSFSSGFLGVLAATGTDIKYFKVKFHDIKLAVAPVTLATEEEDETDLQVVPVVSVPEVASYTSSDLLIAPGEELPLPEAAEAVSPIWNITFDETETFDTPATISVPVSLPHPLGDDEIVTAAYWNGETWVPIGGTLNEEQTELTFTLTHFSKFTVLRLRLPMVPVKTEHFRIIPLVTGEDLETLASRLETAWDMVIEELGFLEPISTLGAGLINVWVHPLLGGAGETERFWLAEHLFDYVNYNIYIKAGLAGVEAISTPAHEFFHIVQINGYLHPYEKSDLGPYLWWMEATATWIGSIFADRDGSFFRGAEYARLAELVEADLITVPLTETGQGHPYLLGPFVEFLETKIPGVVRKTWNHIGTLKAPLDALKEICETHGEDLLTLYCDFLLDYYFAHKLPFLTWSNIVGKAITVTEATSEIVLEGPLLPLAGAALEISLGHDGAFVPTELQSKETGVLPEPKVLLGAIQRMPGDTWGASTIEYLGKDFTMELFEATAAVGLVLLNAKDSVTLEDLPVDFAVVYEVRDAEPPAVALTETPPYFCGTGEVHFKWEGIDNETPSPQLRYSFVLQGHDPDWTSWSSTSEATYRNLPEGSYEFMVRARDTAGNISALPTVYSFHVGSESDLRWTVRYWPTASFGEEKYPGRVVILADPEGRIYLLNVDEESDTYNLVLLSEVMGPTLLWSIPFEQLPGRISDVAVDGRGVCHMIGAKHLYSGRDQYFLYHQITPDGQLTSSRPSWGDYETAINREDVQLKVSPEGVVHVVMSADAVYYGRTEDGTNWVVSLVSEEGKILDFAIDATNNPHILWEFGRRLYYSYQAGDTWVEESLPDIPVAHATITLDSNGNPYVVAGWGESLYYLNKQESGLWDTEKLFSGQPKLVNLDANILSVRDCFHDSPGWRINREIIPFALHVDPSGNTISILSYGKYQYGRQDKTFWFLSCRDGAWRYEPVVKWVPVGFVDWVITSSGSPHLFYLDRDSQRLVELKRGASPEIPSLDESLEVVEPWPTVENLTLFHRSGERVLWKELVDGPTVVVFWDIWKRHSNEDFPMQLLHKWDDIAPAEVELLLVGFSNERMWTESRCWGSHGYEFIQYQLLLDKARWDGFEHSGYLFHGPPQHLPCQVEENTLYYFDNSGYAITYLPHAQEVGLTEIFNWVNKQVPVISREFPHLHILPPLERELRGTISNSVDSSCLKAWSELTGQWPIRFVDHDDFSSKDFYDALLQQVFPPFHSVYALLPPILQNRFEEVVMDYVAMTQERIASLRSYNDYIVQKPYWPLKRARYQYRIDEEGVIHFSDGPSFTLTEADIADFLSGKSFHVLLLTRPRRGSAKGTIIGVILFTRTTYYVWKENFRAKILSMFEAPPEVREEVEAEPESSSSGTPSIIDWSKPFPGSGEARKSLSPIVTLVRGEPDATHVLVHFGRGDEVDQQFQTEYLPSLLDNAQGHGGLLYIFVLCQGGYEGQLKELGVQVVPGFILDGAVLVNCCGFEDVAENVLSIIASEGILDTQ